MSAVLEGFECTHEITVHRNIKPEDILLPEKGSKVKLCDFGLAQVHSKRTLLTQNQNSNWTQGI
jgi:serine/threonine protein kinase